MFLSAAETNVWDDRETFVVSSLHGVLALQTQNLSVKCLRSEKKLSQISRNFSCVSEMK